MVKQEMARVNVNILGISELKWTGMGELNSDDHYIYYCGQESLRRNGVAIILNKRVRNAILGCNLKKDRMISVRFQGKPFNITVIQKKWSSHHTQQKSPKCNTWMQSQKRQNDLCSFPRQTIQYHSNPSLCPAILHCSYIACYPRPILLIIVVLELECV